MGKSSGGLDPRIERSQSAIIAAAFDQFMARGYVRASIDDIAEQAGTSKKTVYNVFGDKERLFRAVVGQAIRIAEDYSSHTAKALSEVSDVEPHLRTAVVELAETVLTGPVIGLRRLLISEVDRFPEFAAEYYARAPGLVMRTLASTLHTLSAEGKLDIGDDALAAEQLAFLAMGPGIDRALFRPSSHPAESISTIREAAHAGVDAFLSIYPPQRDR
ncbi:TetR/AcrR family transcriptional regulator [Nesterenkonia muleiensis]|uniref:TetR/AcrR family transcriptional regulator n=1 Tax=Nesterenkonia muleiensis TaxID=2282648 RepID=UPI000E76E30E|nr:TetR/AcrR family transcriptional regulator [Nesterenkonia muleiensis]